jgi:ABC-type multidrug transport system fused ATPase/permease subunit
MAVSPDGKWAVNTSETTNMLHWIDTSTQTLADSTLVDQRPRFVEFSKDGSQLWASAEIGGTVTILDVATRQVLKTLNFQIKGVHPDKVQPVGIKLSADGKYAFVALGPANHVAVIDAKTFEILDYLLVGRRVWQMAFTPDQKQLLATNGVSGDVSVIDVKPQGAQVGEGRALPLGRGGDTMNALEVSDVSFAYGRARHSAGRFQPGTGRFAALLGPNGAGKSTLIALLTRLYDLQHGDIRVRLLAAQRCTPGAAAVGRGVSAKHPGPGPERRAEPALPRRAAWPVAAPERLRVEAELARQA